MTTFDERADAMERKAARDEELRFKATARRNRLLGLWVAERLGKTGRDAEDYARSVVLADFEEPGPEDVVRKVRKDLEDGGQGVPDTEIRRMMDELLAKAEEQIRAGI